MITYSSFWDFVVKATSILLSACVGPVLGGKYWFVWTGISPRLSAAISVGLGMLVVLFFAFDYMNIASAWLYARLSLGAHVSWEDAKALRVLFQLDEKESWLPMKEVKHFPVLDRREQLLRAAEAHAAQRKLKAFL